MPKRFVLTFFLVIGSGAVIANPVAYFLHMEGGMGSLLEKAAAFFISLVLLVGITSFCLSIVIWRKYSISPENQVDIDEFPKVSVIIPARNEEHNIRLCLENLQKVEYPDMEIIVIDDRSSDRTGEIAAEFARADKRIKLIQGKEPPEEWSGKVHAIHQAVSHATGDWLLFIDADSLIYEKNLVTAISYCLENGLEMLSISMKPHFGTFWENVIMPVVFASILFTKPLHLVNNPDTSVALANGGYILIKASSYRGIGGHEAIRNSMIEDIQLVEMAKANGIPYRFLLGPEMGIQRWYGSFHGIWTGWSKNIFAGRDYQVTTAVNDILLILSLSILPFAVLIQELLTYFLDRDHHSPILWLAFAQVTIVLLNRAYSAFKSGISKSYSLTYPLGSAIFIGIFANSVFRVLTGRGVVWKDRLYRTKGR